MSILIKLIFSVNFTAIQNVDLQGSPIVTTDASQTYTLCQFWWACVKMIKTQYTTRTCGLIVWITNKLPQSLQTINVSLMTGLVYTTDRSNIPGNL